MGHCVMLFSKLTYYCRKELLEYTLCLYCICMFFDYVPVVSEYMYRIFTFEYEFLNYSDSSLLK